VVPIFLYGSGRTLPRGTFVPVPFRIDVFVGPPVPWTGDRADFMNRIGGFFEESAQQVRRH
jgi:hypothetical protein